MAKRYSRAAHSKRRKQTSHVLKNTVILLFAQWASGLAAHSGMQR